MELVFVSGKLSLIRCPAPGKCKFSGVIHSIFETLVLIQLQYTVMIGRPQITEQLNRYHLDDK